MIGLRILVIASLLCLALATDEDDCNGIGDKCKECMDLATKGCKFCQKKAGGKGTCMGPAKFGTDCTGDDQGEAKFCAETCTGLTTECAKCNESKYKDICYFCGASVETGKCQFGACATPPAITECGATPTDKVKCDTCFADGITGKVFCKTTSKCVLTADPSCKDDEKIKEKKDCPNAGASVAIGIATVAAVLMGLFK